jgi:hypothetical protein
MIYDEDRVMEDLRRSQWDMEQCQPCAQRKGTDNKSPILQSHEKRGLDIIYLH